jgi:hypothetical protein
MSVVGKLLVFMNLVFSLVVGTFAVLDYTARTHWKDSHDKLAIQLAIEKGTATGYKDVAEKLSKEKAELNEKLRTSLDKQFELSQGEDPGNFAKRLAGFFVNLKQVTEQLKTEIVALQKQVRDEKAKILGYETVNTTLQENNKQRQEEIRKMGDLLVLADKKSRDLLVERNRMRDDKVAAEIEATALRDKNVQMAGRLAELERDLARIKVSGTAVARRPGGGVGGVMPPGAPPPDGLEGRILQVAERNLVKISVGSDNGLSTGNVLQVFRLGTNPKWLGKIKIVSVQPDTAVGQLEGRAAGAFQKDDIVATGIMGR